MSNYGATPPPGTYQNASQQGYNPQQQQQGHQPGHGHKSGGAFGQMMTLGQQAVTTSKPMLDKLGKTISSKLGSKPAPGPPQHLQSYQNYQQHNAPQGQSQGHQQTPNQAYSSPQPQQQQWQQPQQQTPPAPNMYNAAQPSPYQQQANYGTPASAHSNQTNYFAQQNVPPTSQSPNIPPPPNTQPPSMSQQASHTPTFHTPSFGLEQQGQQGQPISGQFPGQYQQEQNSQYGGQQTGVISGVTTPNYGQTQPPMYQQNTDTPHVPPPSSGLAAQMGQQSQWGYPPEKTGLHNVTQQQYQPASSPSFQQPDQQQQPIQQPQQQQQQQHWNPMSPMSPQGQAPSPAPYPPVSPPPPQQQMNLPPPAQPPTPASQHITPASAPTEFIAELPADMGNLQLADPPHAPAPQAAQYKAYSPSPQNAPSPTKGFSVPRRAMSASSIPFADPWRWADPTTDQPTREFFVMADLLFDALDRKFEPRNTGLLEAPKVLASWIDTTNDARRKCGTTVC